MSTLTNPTELLAIREASEFLKVKVSTLYAWVYQRKIPFRKHGSQIVFHTEELRAWSEKRRVPEHLSQTWESAGARDTEGAGSLKTRRTEETP